MKSNSVFVIFLKGLFLITRDEFTISTYSEWSTDVSAFLLNFSVADDTAETPRLSSVNFLGANLFSLVVSPP
jgi:hypothetical protein